MDVPPDLNRAVIQLEGCDTEYFEGTRMQDKKAML